jgi:XTP/dITP diphosphohydrolase
MTRRVVAVATRNPGKLREIRAILGECGLELRAVDDSVSFPDEGDEYEANAVQKARAAAEALGVPALADDSGLEVDALAGGPGPRSARYGGFGLDDAGRAARLLEALAGVPREKRGARFVCIAALVRPDGSASSARGVCEGRILTAPRGAGGFGYDPVFWIDELGAAAAELPPSAKDRVSHRARAFCGLIAALAAL